MEDQRKYCCCFKRKRSLISCIILTILLLIAIALLVYFLFPRMPELYLAFPEDAINSFDLSSGTNPVAFVGALLGASASNPLTIIMNMSISLTVYSPNHIDINVKSISSDLWLIGSDGQIVGGEESTLLGETEVTDITFHKLTNTTITPDLLIRYSRVLPLQKSATDPVLLHLYETCVNPNPSKPRKLKFKYTVVVDVKIISFTGYRPTVSGTSFINCPDLSGLSPAWKVLDQLPSNFGKN
jgi:hypothetical protein